LIAWPPARVAEPASPDFLRLLHREFYKDAPEDMLRIQGAGREFVMKPGEWRSQPEHNVVVAATSRPPVRGSPISWRTLRGATALRARQRRTRHGHGRFTSPLQLYPSVPGRKRPRQPPDEPRHGAQCRHRRSRPLSVSRGLSRGLESRTEYKRMMDLADTPRQGDLDGRGNLSLRALNELCCGS